MSMRDFLGKELDEGDEVVYIRTYSRSGDLKKGVIKGFTPTLVVMENGDKKTPSKVIKVNH